MAREWGTFARGRDRGAERERPGRVARFAAAAAARVSPPSLLRTASELTPHPTLMSREEGQRVSERRSNWSAGPKKEEVPGEDGERESGQEARRTHEGRHESE